ncbi:MAG: DNA alkylation repair protein [Eubacteriales bacterium]
MQDKIIKDLFDMQDLKYAEFNRKLIPNIAKESIIGVRTPDLRTYAKTLIKQESTEQFLRKLPHEYFEENQLHAFLISEIKDFDNCITELNLFLPFVDNWATCDQMSPKIFKKHKQELLKYIQIWLESDKTYTVRFAIGMLMQHFLDENFDIEYLETVAKIQSDEYYVNMMIAWYFATALAKKYEQTLPYIEDKMLETWTHNKTIQKAIESYRITDEQKTYLRGLKIRLAKKEKN